MRCLIQLLWFYYLESSLCLNGDAVRSMSGEMRFHATGLKPRSCG